MIIVDVNLLIYAINEDVTVPSKGERLARVCSLGHRDGGTALDYSSRFSPSHDAGRSLPVTQNCVVRSHQ
jgi:hypothetical protein